SQSLDSQKCKVCGKVFTRDMPRHMRIHEPVARFICPYPRDQCSHKRGQFNRQYDFKKHLLHDHFIFDDPSARKEHTLTSKLSRHGQCLCGERFVGGEWLDEHILAD
ncbi:hypothetical protein CANCADRAFT_17868, partial [Tortispora caseinolytica NRRL Y-17796]